jgi:hypothetical protein
LVSDPAGQGLIHVMRLYGGFMRLYGGFMRLYGALETFFTKE